MTVAELIERLKQFDPSQMVMVNGYEGGLKDVKFVGDARVRLNVNTERYYGPHEASYEDENHDVVAVTIS